MSLSDKPLSDHTVWEMLSTHRNMDKMIENLSVDAQVATRLTITRLNTAFSLIERLALVGLDSIPREKEMGEQREYVREMPCSDVVLAMYDGDDYARLIWNMIEPGNSMFSNRELAEAVDLLRLVVSIDGYRWPEITTFLSNVERSGWAASQL